MEFLDDLFGKLRCSSLEVHAVLLHEIRYHERLLELLREVDLTGLDEVAEDRACEGRFPHPAGVYEMAAIGLVRAATKFGDDAPDTVLIVEEVLLIEADVLAGLGLILGDVAALRTD